MFYDCNYYYLCASMSVHVYMLVWVNCTRACACRGQRLLLGVVVPNLACQSYCICNKLKQKLLGTSVRDSLDQREYLKQGDPP